MGEQTYQQVIAQRSKRYKFAVESRRRFAIVTYILYPLAALFYAIKNYRDHWAKNAAWCFIIFYGFTFVISSEEIDANRYRDIFLVMAEQELTATNFINLLYSEETNYVDIVQPLLSFVLSLFTDNYRVLFAVFGAFFGYFYTRNIWYLLERAGPRIRWGNLPYIITFAFIVGFWEINGFRFWTAAHVFFFGAFRYLVEGNRKGILIAIFSVFIHFSYAIPVLVLVGYAMLGNRTHLFFLFFVATFLLSEIDLGVVRTVLLTYLPSAFDLKVESYTSEHYAERVKASTVGLSWHAVYFKQVLKWVNTMFIFFIYFKGMRFIRSNKQLLAIFSFSLLFLGMGNIVSLVPSGERFLIVGYLFSMALIFLYMQHAPPSRLMSYVKLLALPALALYCIVNLRIGFDTIGIMTVIGNPLIAMFGNIDMPLIELIK